MDKFIEFITTNRIFPSEKAVIALGVFDGVHPGHRKVIAAASALAAETGGRAGAVTFIPHPRQILGNANDLKLLMPESDRIAALTASGAEFVCKINFSGTVAGWDAEDFLKRLQNCGLFELAGICVGSNWRFGRNGSGNRELLAGFCRKNHIRFIPVEEVEDHGNIVSSTLIRKLTAAGELDEVRRIYGDHARISGTVKSGMHAASRDLKAPTANIELQYGVMVPDGVYAGYSDIAGKRFPAVLNIGCAPTYDVQEKRIEVHLIGFEGDLYGRMLTVALVKKLRDIRKFSSVDELKTQIAQDIAEAQQLL